MVSFAITNFLKHKNMTNVNREVTRFLHFHNFETWGKKGLYCTNFKIFLCSLRTVVPLMVQKLFMMGGRYQIETL